MRIIKLSAKDAEFKTEEDVDTFFCGTLLNRNPQGKFLLTRNAIGAKGISHGEKIIFSYKGTCIYTARAASERNENEGPEANKYPYYTTKA